MTGFALDLSPLADLVAERVLAASGQRQPEVLTTRQCAELLQLSETTLLALAKRGEVPARKLDGQWRFRRSAVLASLEPAQAEAHATD